MCVEIAHGWGIDSIKTGCKLFHCQSLPHYEESCLWNGPVWAYGIHTSVRWFEIRKHQPKIWGRLAASYKVDHWTGDGRTGRHAKKSLLMSPRGIRMVSSTSLEVGMETRSSMICFSAFAQPQSERGQRPWATEQNNNLSLSDLSSQRTWTAAYECMWEFLQWFWDDMLTLSHDHFSLLTASFKAAYSQSLSFHLRFMLDVENKDWSDVDLNWGVPRWNMAAQLVEAGFWAGVFWYLFDSFCDSRCRM